MSKKETRRAARQAFPKAPTPTKSSKTVVRGSGATRSTRGAKGKTSTQPALRPPTLKRAAIQAPILAVLYLMVIRFIWREPGTSAISYVIFPLAGFFIYTGIAYAIDRWTLSAAPSKTEGLVEVTRLRGVSRTSAGH